MTRLRFCLVTTFYPPYSFGGDGIAVRRLARALRDRGHEVTVVFDADAFETLDNGPAPAPVAPDPGIEVVALRSGWGPLSPLLTQQLGRPVLNRTRLEEILAGGFDVIHYHNVSLLGGPEALSMGDALKAYTTHEYWLVCPTHVLWRHNREPCTGRECLRCTIHYRRPPQAWRYTGLLERHVEAVDLFIAPSDFSREMHRRFGFEREMEVIPHFLPATPAAGTMKKGRPPAHPRPYFLFAGRLERIKGLHDVIPLFADHPDADLLVAGAGSEADALRRLAGGNPRVIFLGRVEPEALEALQGDAVAALVPSVFYETFGLAAIEAARVGTPMIVRDRGPLPDLARLSEGMVFSTPGELLVHMRTLQADVGERRRRGRAAARAFAAHWSEGVVLPRYLEALARAAGAAGRRRLARELEAGA